jgi:hypothetical protein
MHGTKESFTLESVLKRGEYIADGHHDLFIDGAKNSNFSFTRQKIQNFSLKGQKQKIFP